MHVDVSIHGLGLSLVWLLALISKDGRYLRIQDSQLSLQKSEGPFY